MSIHPVTHRGRNVPPLDTKRAERASHVIELLRGSWTTHVLFAMDGRSIRLSDLKRMIPTASKKALTASLRLLEDTHIVVRRDLSRVRLHVEYEISDSMRDPIGSLLDFLSNWADFLPEAQKISGIPVAGQRRFKSRSP